MDCRALRFPRCRPQRPGCRRRARGRGLYARAIGIERTVKRTALYRGEPKDFETNVYFPPDTQACIFWLRNRRRQTWRDAPNAVTAEYGDDDIARLEAASESVRRRGVDHDRD